MEKIKQMNTYQVTKIKHKFIHLIIIVIIYFIWKNNSQFHFLCDFTPKEKLLFSNKIQYLHSQNWMIQSVIPKYQIA